MKNKGSVIALVLVFGSVFLILLTGLLGFILLQHRQSLGKAAWNESLHLAEAGLNYAKWHLLHSPEDYAFGGIKDYADAGQFQLEIIPSSGCSSGVTITSKGWTSDFPNVQRAVRIKYAKPSLAQYAFLTESNIWFGENESTRGPVHSNGGIRMDGIQNSLFNSAKETYLCGAEHGCDPPQDKPGIWGSGQGGVQGLWEFPVPAIDFDIITQDLDVLKQEAQASGIYITQPVDHGYHVRFNGNGTVDVFRVKKLKQKVWGWDGEEWIHESNDIDEEEWQATYDLPSNCAPIFIENNVWVDGSVNGKAVLVAAELPESSNRMRKIIVNGNISYTDSSSVLGLISQSDILIPLYSPDSLEIEAAMLAQNGHVFRYYYPKWSSEPYNTYAIRNSIETNGSIITNEFWTFTWVDEGGSVTSGYRTTNMSYDANLTYNPPPYFPTSGEYEFLGWEEL